MRRFVVLLALASFTASFAAAQDDRRREGFQDGLDRTLVTEGQRIVVRAAPSTRALELLFVPEGDPDRPIVVGIDEGAGERAMGPDCDEPCVVSDEFSVIMPRHLRGVPEGWGRLVARDPDTGAEMESGPLYWDETPPRSEFLAPRFNAEASGLRSWPIVAFSPDENLQLVVVKWQLATENARLIPRFEQHKLGMQFANNGHAACVPTSIAALLKWLDVTGQWQTVKPFFTDQFMVNSLGAFMGTTNGGTSGSGGVNGTVDFLNFWFGYQRNVHYRLKHDVAPGSSTQFGFMPQQLYAECQNGGAVAVGLHNMPPSEDPNVFFNDPPFGHAMVLDDMILNADGSAWVRLMDPNVEPPGSDFGKYRWFKMNLDGTLNWKDANVEYYNPFPFTGKVRLDELYVLSDFVNIPGNASAALALNDIAEGGPPPGRHYGNTDWRHRRREIPTAGVVHGIRLLNNRLFLGMFRPPKGSPGPWLLITEATDAAGFTQRDFQLVGAALRDNDEPPADR